MCVTSHNNATGATAMNGTPQSAIQRRRSEVQLTITRDDGLVISRRIDISCKIKVQALLTVHGFLTLLSAPPSATDTQYSVQYGLTV